MANKLLQKRRIAIIGGGMAGVTAARHLTRAGASVTVLEKSRGLGGRMATRRMEGGTTADHGAQYFTARTPAFQAFVQGGLDNGTFADWQPEGRNGDTAPAWYVGTPAMNTPLKAGADGIDVQLNNHVAAVAREGNAVRLTLIDAADQWFDQVIITTPAPQAAALVQDRHPDMATALDGVTIAPCWTLMLVLDQPLAASFGVWRKDHPMLGWAARNSSKPGRDFIGDSWTVQANPAWSEQNLELEKEVAAEQLLTAFQTLVGAALSDVAQQTAHRWRYAKTTTPLGKPFFKDEASRIYMAGDWCLGARVEYAFESGLAAARDVVAGNP